MTEFQNFVKNTVEPELFNKTLFQEWLRERLKFGVGYVGVADNNLPTENYMKQVINNFGGNIFLFINFNIRDVSVYDIIERVKLEKPEWMLTLEDDLYEQYWQQSVLGSQVLDLLV